MASNRANTYLAYCVFIISPILGLPLMLQEVYKKNKSSVVFISLILALLSFYWVPASYFDKAHYIEFYEHYKELKLSEFIRQVISKKVDFIFYFFLYFCATFHIKFYFCVAIITFTTSYFIHDFFLKMFFLLSRNKKYFIWYFFGITISISFAYFFSGLRFYLGVSLFLQALFCLYTGNIKKFLLFYALAALSHFSFVMFLPAIVLYGTLNKKVLVIKAFYFFSLFFLFIQREQLFSLLSFGFLGDDLGQRVNVYLDETDNVEQQLAGGSIYFTIKYYLTLAFYFISTLFITLNIKRKDKYFLILLACFIITNLFGSVPFIFLRFTLSVNTVLFLVLLFSSDSFEIRKFRKFAMYLTVPVILTLFFLEVALFLPSFRLNSRIFDFVTLFSVFFENIPDYPPATNS